VWNDKIYLNNTKEIKGIVKKVIEDVKPIKKTRQKIKYIWNYT
jgi:hypothetical protein